MHAVDVGIGRDDDLVVAQTVDAVLDAEGAHDVVELLVLVDRLAPHAVGVERLALEGVDGLRLHVARLDHGAAGRVALGDEERRLLPPLALCIAQVDLAVDQLGDADRHLLGAFAGLLLDRRQLLAHLLVLFDLGDELVCFARVLVQPEHDLVLDRVDDPGPDLRRTELVLGLALEHRVLKLDRHRADQAVAHVLACETVLRVLVDPLEHALRGRRSGGCRRRWCTDR